MDLEDLISASVRASHNGKFEQKGTAGLQQAARHNQEAEGYRIRDNE